MSIAGTIVHIKLMRIKDYVRHKLITNMTTNVQHYTTYLPSMFFIIKYRSVCIILNAVFTQNKKGFIL